jgi:hypothetical protein
MHRGNITCTAVMGQKMDAAPMASSKLRRPPFQVRFSYHTQHPLLLHRLPYTQPSYIYTWRARRSTSAKGFHISKSSVQTNLVASRPSLTLQSLLVSGDMAPGQFAIDMLLDEVLLDIFACYVEESQSRDAWHTLACVCRRWRSIAFGSPRRLNLRIFCSDRKPVRKNLDLWPPFPIVLTAKFYDPWILVWIINLEDNVLATLERHDRICDIKIWNISSSLWEKALPLMQKPFPTLTDLDLRRKGELASVAPDSFLGGSATRLRRLTLGGIPFPGLPKLLLSATHLVHLELYDIPDSGYIGPEAMVTCLSALTGLQFFKLESRQAPPPSEWNRRCTGSSTRALLPSLTGFTFEGASGYLEDIVNKIDAFQLDRLEIILDEPIFDTQQLAQFISRVPKLKTCNQVRLWLGDYRAAVNVFSLSKTTNNAFLRLQVWYGQRDVQMSPLVQLCTSFLPQALISTVEGLIIDGESYDWRAEQGDNDLILWRELLQPFTAVKDLYLSWSCEIPSRIAPVLQELVGERVFELFPVLQNISLQTSRPVPEGIKQFVAARQLTSHPISVRYG